MGCLKSKLVSRVANGGRGGETGGGERRRAGRQAGAVMSMLPSVIQRAQTVVPAGRSYRFAARRTSFNARSLVILCLRVPLGVWNCRIFLRKVQEQTFIVGRRRQRCVRYSSLSYIGYTPSSRIPCVGQRGTSCVLDSAPGRLVATRIRSSFREGLFLRASRTEVDISPAVSEGACGSARGKWRVCEGHEVQVGGDGGARLGVRQGRTGEGGGRCVAAYLDPSPPLPSLLLLLR